MDLTKRILFTLFILVIYRIGLWIPLPGINPEILFYYDHWGQIESFVDRFSLFSLGVWPYISAYIVLWLLKMVIPSLRKRSIFHDPSMDQYVRYGTIVICIIQSIGLLMLFKQSVITESANFTLSFILTFILVMTSGTLFLVWLADQITKRGVGNGFLLILFAGFADEFIQFKELLNDGKMNRLTPFIILLAFSLMIALVVVRQLSARHIPVEGRDGQSKITFKVHPINDYLIITFASLPVVFISQLFSLFYLDNHFLRSIANALSPGSIVYYLESIILLTLIGYFAYRAIYYNPHTITHQLDKDGGKIPGLSSGEATRVYFTKVLSYLALPASIILVFVAIYPDLLIKITSIHSNIAYLMGGINIIIAVGAALSVAQSIRQHKKQSLERIS